LTGKIHSQVYALDIWLEPAQISFRAYLVKDGKNTMIDTGPPLGSPEKLAEVLKAYDLALKDINFILNTHGHFDHIGGNAPIKKAGNPQIMIHREDASFLEDHNFCFEQFFAPVTKASNPQEDLAKARDGFLQEMGPELKVDRRLEDNDLLAIGDNIELRVIHLPGHTLGSVGYYWEKEGMIFTGDSICGLSTPDGSLPIIYDLEAYKQSIKRLLDIPLNMILGCHPYRGISLPPSAIRMGVGEVKRFLEDSLEAAERITEAVATVKGDKEQPLAEVADQVIARLPASMAFKPIAQLMMPQFTLTTVYNALYRNKG
jgi:glyoxylase-like metal-dependent hydrolase (beta-lactamase superfamily II)